MDFIEKVIGDSIFVVWYNGEVTSVLAKKTASEAMDILGRELYPWEEFYWIASIENKSWIRWAGTELLKYLISVSWHWNRSYGVDARPLKDSVWKLQNPDQRIPWLINWYQKHGFVYSKRMIDFYAFIYNSWIAKDNLRPNFDLDCWISDTIS